MLPSRTAGTRLARSLLSCRVLGSQAQDRRMSSEKFLLADKYTGLEKNVWCVL